MKFRNLNLPKSIRAASYIIVDKVFFTNSLAIVNRIGPEYITENPRTWGLLKSINYLNVLELFER